MRVLVIGGTGFFGTRLVPNLIEPGHEVTVLTRSREKTSNLEGRGTGAVIGDLRSIAC